MPTNLYRFYLLITVVTLLFFSGCNQNKQNKSSLKVFRYNESAGITSLDPAFARTTENIWVLNQLYNGLLQLDSNLQLIPSIAKKWQVSENGLEYRFTLRSDVFFHENECFGKLKTRRVIANDFVFSYNRILDESLSSPGSWVFSNVREKGFVAENDSVFVIYLKQAFSPFLNLLTHQYCSVVPKEAIDFYASNFRANPVGTGPFCFKRWLEGEKLVLLKNKKYFESVNGKKLPFIDAIALSFIKDKQTAYLAFLKNKFDFMSGLDGSYKDDLLNFDGSLKSKHKGNFLMHRMPFLKTDYFGILLNNKNVNPLQNLKIRQAISACIDRRKLITFLRNGIGIPSQGSFVAEGLNLPNKYNPKHYQYNPEYAKQLIKESGIILNVNNPIVITTTSVYADVCEFVQQQLNECGIPSKIQVLPSAVNSESIAKGEIDFFRKSWVADFPDAENFLSVFCSSKIPPQGPNYARFSNAVFDSIYAQSISTIDANERIKLYFKLDSIIAQECPVISLYYDEAVVFYHNNLSGLQFNSLNLLQLKTVKIK
jgi:peptide/nickel transport system substrate-binding protein